MSDNHDTDHGYDFDDFLSPGDGEVARAITGSTARGLFLGMCLAGFVMAALMSKLFLQEVRGLPAGEIEDAVVDYAGQWHQQMSSLKLDLFMAGIRAQVEYWQDVTWDDTDCAIGNMVPSGSGFDSQTETLSSEPSCPD
jgi:hypothetical protein